MSDVCVLPLVFNCHLLSKICTLSNGKLSRRELGMKVCINGPGHITKMATTSIYGKNLQKTSSPEAKVI